jgi:hypothetical protein
MTELTLETLRSELQPLQARLDALGAELAAVRVRVDGLPLMGVALEILKRDVQLLRSSAPTEPTPSK